MYSCSTIVNASVTFLHNEIVDAKLASYSLSHESPYSGLLFTNKQTSWYTLKYIFPFQDVLCKTPFELVRCLGLGYPSVRDLQLEVSRACAPESISVLELWKSKKKMPMFLSTSLPQLDEVLHGGLPVATITEITGPSGCGKTQFCMMMSLLATQSHDQGGLNGEVVYIDTESAFSAQRLENFEDFLITHHIKFIIIDSIASLIRKEFDCRSGKNMIARTNLLSREAAILKKIAEDFAIPITTRYDSGSKQTNGGSDDLVDGSYVTAALGNTWSHCVNTRLILQYKDASHRQLLVAKSPVAPFTNLIYTIEARGLVLQGLVVEEGVKTPEISRHR
ncbi:hypothetical protein LSH36_1g15005 [Paralvinella palmiformis]|uniref:RecA family profile 1 domain-containing protein n=1 Tax=Paralvinella palmiformis TaxID=53620 RepID=A0AAD9KGH6_9ANNE|nr:hypothetical protein LSH36_1g15005 [Paralvinella palmiformis]